MTRDELISIARQAGSVIELAQEKDLHWLMRFARLVEHRKCAELARKIEAMPFGTTGESFAVWIREQAHE